MKTVTQPRTDKATEETFNVTLELADCFQSLLGFYNRIAGLCGKCPSTSKYDCAKILVTKPVMEAIFFYYENVHSLDRESFNSYWASLGPKASLSYDDSNGSPYLALIQKGFFVNRH